MHDFRKLAGLRLKEPTVIAPRGVGLGADADQYETPSIGDPAAVAAAIIAAGVKARNGGDTAPKLSTLAEQILDAGKKRGGE